MRDTSRQAGRRRGRGEDDELLIVLHLSYSSSLSLFLRSSSVPLCLLVFYVSVIRCLYWIGKATPQELCAMSNWGDACSFVIVCMRERHRRKNGERHLGFVVRDEHLALIANAQRYSLR